MKKVFIIIFLMYGNFLYAQYEGYHFVAPADSGGLNSNEGTFAKPWATWDYAFSKARPGDTVYFRAGVYWSTQRNVINPEDGKGYSGTVGKPISYFGFPPDIEAGNMPILDCSNNCEFKDNSSFYNYAIRIEYAQYLHFKDLEIRNVFQCDSVVSGAITGLYSRHLTFEHILLHDVGERGYWMQGGAWKSWYDIGGTLTAPYWSDNYYDTTSFINCDVYNLCDTFANIPGNAADGWIATYYDGNVVTWDGCRVWNYTDDAMDLIPANGAKYTINNCWLLGSDKYEGIDALATPGGIKMSANSKVQKHNRRISVTNSLMAFMSDGISSNIFAAADRGGADGNDYLLWENDAAYYNNISYKNDIGFYEHVDNSENNTMSPVWKNNIAYASRKIVNGTVDTPLNWTNTYGRNTPSDESHNTWDWYDGYPGSKTTDSVTVTDADFIYNDSAYIASLITAQRELDGSLPAIHPFTLASTSDLIDKGTDVGFPFYGKAPDIGPFEYDTVPGTKNKYPTISITSPANGSIFTSNDNIPIKVKAFDADGIDKIEIFYQDTIYIGEPDESGSLYWNNAPIGDHFLRAVVTDNNNAKATSSRIHVIVGRGSDSDLILIFPNPNDGNFTIFLTEPLQTESVINIISLEGRLIKSFDLNERTKQLDLSWMSAGLYILVLTKNKGILSSSKFIKV
ncbi:MAG: T9SS type A sorting domain-containing protein [Bacteroidales bacterium]|nr:T9SS type A sorting domain-containing protein [Bacteroidales bacterium]MCF8390624.1 T9SS type A sorting domain-containing protein [Bacteroidales bacterium]